LLIAVAVNVAGFVTIPDKQPMLASQPGFVTDPSLWNTNVRDPLALFAITVPGEFVPQYVPSKVAEVLFPS
jgi:hypothetical protein